MSNLADYIQYELTQAVASGIDRLFPLLNFRRRSNTWYSKCDINGNNRGKDTLFVYCNNPLKIHSQQGDKWDIIDYFANGRNAFEAVKEIANILGIMPPPDNQEGEWSQYKERQNKLEQAHAQFISNLWSDEAGAEEARQYLRNRGWQDEEIKKAQLGFISTALKSKLPIIEYSNSEGKNVNMFYPSFVGGTHTIVIPVYQRGKLQGFKVRTTNPDETQKYKNIGFLKRNGMYDLTPYNSSGEDCVLVEGDLDALHALVKGTKGVCSTLGGALSQEQAQDALKRGYKHYILFFDNDEAGVKFTNDTIALLEKMGQRVYVVDYKQAQNQALKDPDEIITKLGIEEFNTLTQNAVPTWRFKAQNLVNSAVARNGDNFTYIAFDDCKFDCIALLKEYPEHREEIIKYILPIFGGEGAEAPEDIKKQIAKAEAEYNKAIEATQQAQRVNETLAKVSELQAKGQTEAAAELLSNFRNGTSRRRNFAADFADRTPEEFKRLLAEQPQGTPTGLIFETEAGNYKSGRGIAVPFLLEQGVSFVCASTGHGKTSFLNMLALNEASRILQQEQKKQVLYFSFEVNQRLMFIDLLNNFVNDPEISADIRVSPQKALLAYFKGDTGAINSNIMQGKGISHRSYFEQKLREFSSKYIKTLKVVYCNDYDVNDLIAAIKYQYEATGGNISVVFIDYAQLLYKEGDEKLQRYEQIKSIVDDLNKLAQSLNIPIVCAAQFNQSKEEPITMSEKNIGEGSDFSRIATTIIGLFNLDKLYKIDPTTILPQKQLSALNMVLGKFNLSPIDETNPMPRGYFLVKLLKCRNDLSGISTIINWNGANKHLSVNYPDEIFKDMTPKQASLFDEPAPSQNDPLGQTQNNDYLPF